MIAYGIYRLKRDRREPGRHRTTSAIVTGAFFSAGETMGNLWAGSRCSSKQLRIGDWVRIDDRVGQVVSSLGSCHRHADHETIVLANSAR